MRTWQLNANFSMLIFTSSLEYEKAFIACRRHRIDLKIMIEHNEELFYNNLATFVQQLSNAEHFNLFLTSVG